MGNFWNNKEIDFLKENYKNKTDAEIGLILGRSRLSVKSKRQDLGYEKDKAHRKYNFTDVINEFKKTDYILLSNEEDYIDSATNSIKYICPKHKDKGIQTISLGHLQSGRGCYYCGRENTIRKKTLSDLEVDKACELLCKKRSFEYKGFHRENGNIIIEYICPNHKYIGVQYMAKGNMNRDNIVACPFCFETKKFKFSKGEKRVKKVLNNLNMQYVEQYTFNDCRDINLLPFDFYLPKENKCIEYDGQHHYKPTRFNGVSEEQAIKNHQTTIKHDNIKNNYCKNNNIDLLRIPYYEYNNIDTIIRDFLCERNTNIIAN